MEAHSVASLSEAERWDASREELLALGECLRDKGRNGVDVSRLSQNEGRSRCRSGDDIRRVDVRIWRVCC